MEKQVNVVKNTVQCITIVLLFLGVTEANAHPLIQYWQNRTTSSKGLVIEPRFSVFSTTENFDLNSNRVALPSNFSVSRYYIDLNANYSLSDDFYIFGRLSLLNSQVKGIGIDVSTFGLSDQLIGAAYRLYAVPNGISISAQMDLIIPAYSTSNQVLSGQPYSGDGSSDVIIGGFAEIPLNRAAEWFAEAGIAFRARSNSFSSALPWSAMVKREPVGKGFLFSGGLRGQISMNTDGSSTLAAASTQLAGAGGSTLIFAINPSWMLGQAEIGFRTARGHSFYLNGAFPITGKVAPVGIAFAAGAKFDFDSSGTLQQSEDYADYSRAHQEKRTSRTEREKTATRTIPVPPSAAGAFQSYDLSGLITGVNDQLYIAKLDKGLNDNVVKGQIFDIFQVIEEPGTGRKRETRIARAKVSAVKTSDSALTVVEYFVDQWIEIGFVARRLVE